MGKAKRKINVDADQVHLDGAPVKKKKKKHMEIENDPEIVTNNITEKKKKKKKKRNKEKTGDKLGNVTEPQGQEEIPQEVPSGDRNQESHEEPKSGKPDYWKLEDTVRLVNYFLTLPAISDTGLSHATAEEDINWDEVHIEGISVKDSKQKFQILSKVAKRKITIGELCPLIHRIIDDPAIQRYHGIQPVKKKSQTQARKTVTPQQMYVDGMVKKELQENPQVNVKERKEHYRKKWFNLKDSKKVKWIQMAVQNKESAEEGTATKIFVSKAEIKLKDKAAGVPEQPPGSGYALFCKRLMPELKDVKGTEKFTICGQRWKALNDEEKNQYLAEHTKQMEEYKQKYEAYLNTLPQEQRLALMQKNKPKKKASTAKTPKKPSKAAGSTLTKEMYTQVVKPDLQQQHPELSEIDIVRKISQNYMRLTPEEITKYEFLHTQLNQKRITDFFQNGQTSPSSSESTPKQKMAFKSPSPKKSPKKNNMSAIVIENSDSQDEFQSPVPMKENVKKKMVTSPVTGSPVRVKETSPTKSVKGSMSATSSKKVADSSSSEESSEDETVLKKNSPKKAPPGGAVRSGQKPDDSSTSDSDSDSSDSD